MNAVGTRTHETTHDVTWLKRFLLGFAVALGIAATTALALGLLSRADFLISTALSAALLGLVLAIGLLRLGSGHELHVFTIASVGHYVFMLALLPLVPQLAAAILPTAIIPVFVATPYLRHKGLALYSAVVMVFCLVYAALAIVLAHASHVEQLLALARLPAGSEDASAPLAEHVGRMDVAFAAQLLGVIVVIAIILSLLLRYATADGQVRHLALHDSLTGLANRTLFMERVAHALERGRRRGGGAAVLFLDVDGFKSVNDQHGHAYGDEVLRRVARLIDESTRAADTAARLGGDEFAILIEDVNQASDVQTVAERLQSLLARPLEMPDGGIQVKVSVGVAFASSADADADALLRSADDAMYESKRQGRGELVEYRPAMSAAAAERRYVKRAFRGVVERGELRVQFQPIIRIGADQSAERATAGEPGAVVGVEALVRWQDPERGWRMPAEFVSLAEETGDIVPIGRWVLQEAASHVARWRALAGQDHLRLAVNISGRQLRLRSFEDDVMDALGGAGLPPDAIVLEVSETVLARAERSVGEVLARLRTHGVLVALDDLGSGHASFGTLRDNAVDFVKLDRTLVAAGTSGRADEAVLRTAVELGKAVDATLVAEGIETSAQLDLLRRLGCGLGQGYLFTAPLDPTATTELLTGATYPWRALLERADVPAEQARPSPPAARHDPALDHVFAS